MILLAAALMLQAAEPDEYIIPETACYTRRDFTHDVTDGEDTIRIAGEFWLPAPSEARPTVLMITGSGDHVRQQFISGSPMFGMIGDALARAGFNVVLADPRGFGETTVNGETFEGPHWLQIPSSMRLRDNQQLVDWLAGQPAVSDLIVLGHSEGAMISARLAGGEHPVSSIILLSDSAAPGIEVFARQRADFMRREGVDDATAERTRLALIDFGHFVAGPNWQDDAAFAPVAQTVIDAQSDLDEPFFTMDFLNFFRSESPWHREFMTYDPRGDLERIAVPVVAVYGGADDATPPATHLPVLADALANAPAAEASIHLLPDQDHFFLEFEGERVDRHPYGQVRIAPELTTVLIDELARRYGAHAYCSD